MVLDHRVVAGQESVRVGQDPIIVRRTADPPAMDAEHAGGAVGEAGGLGAGDAERERHGGSG